MKSNKPAVVIITADNILFNTDYYLYLYLFENIDAFSKYIPAKKLLSVKDFYKRKNANFLFDLMSEKYINDKRAFVDIGYNLSLLTKHLNIYTDNEPSSLMKGTLMNMFYVDNPQVEQIYVVVNKSNEKQIKEALNYWKVNESKVKYIVNSGSSLHVLIKDIAWDLLVTDDYKEIKYIAEKDNVENKEFLAPLLGFTNLEKKTRILIDEKGGTFSQYVPE